MLYNYLKTAIRNLRRERFFTIINLTGLSFGLAVSLTIFIYIYQEVQYDTFHPHSDNTYRLATTLALGGKEGNLNATHPPLKAALEESVPEIRFVSRVDVRNGLVFQVEDEVFEEDKIVWADPDFLEIFGFELLHGNKEDALSRPSTILLTPELSAKYFDKPLTEVIGETITINQQLHEVTGIISAPPSNSHIKFRGVMSIIDTYADKDLSWDNLNLSTYVTTTEQTSQQQLVNSVQQTFIDQTGYDPSNGGMLINYFAQPIADIHLQSNLDGEFETNGNLANLYIFLAIAVVILVLACVNFMNLSTARSMYRAKEVGVRKVLGSSSGSLRKQFLFESTLMTVIAMLFALGITELLRLPLSSILGKDFGVLNVLGWQEGLVLVVFTIGIGILAGSYPAIFLSSFSPATVLKGKLYSGSKGRRLRNGLVALQFIISCTLITATLLFNRQVQFMRNVSLGFDKENVIQVKNANRIANPDVFIQQLANLQGVESASISDTQPLGNYNGTQMSTPEDLERLHLVNIIRVNPSYIPTMKMSIQDGRNFNRDLAGDSTAIILNETAAAMMFPMGALEKKLMFKGGTKVYEVVGVIDDFNFESLRQTIMPLVIFNSPRGRILEVRLQAGDYSNALSNIEDAWKRVAPDTPFNYTFIDQQYNQLYQNETRTGGLVTGFTLIAVVIACLGLLGLAAYMTEQRNKEIGVRKTLGASVPSIVFLLSSDFIKIVGIGFILSIPITWFLIDQWLQNYAYKIEPGVITYFIGGIIALLLAIGTISYQSIRAAMENPINTLKDE